MRVSDWHDLAVRADETLRRGLQILDATAAQILLVVDAEGRLEGTVTDGDIRRALLAGHVLESSLSEALNAQPITGAAGLGRPEALAIMRRLSIHALPLLAADGTVSELVFDLADSVATARQTTVVVMAGGRGVRLRPLTDTVPKPLVKVGGVPLAEATVRRLHRQGFNNLWFAVHYRAADIESHFGDGRAMGVNVRYLQEKEPLGTVGAVALLPESQRDCVLVINGDLITAIDFGAVVDFHVAAGAVATLGVVAHVTELPFGVVYERDGVLTGIDEKPSREDLVSAGVAVLSRAAVDRLVAGEACDMPDLMRALALAGETVSVVRLDDYWLDVGTHQSLSVGEREHSLDQSN